MATVTSAGVLTALAPGTTTIAASSQNTSGTALVTVAPIPIVKVDIVSASTGILVGDTLRLTAVPRDSAGNAVSGRIPSWTTNAPAVATVSASGVVTPLALGTAIISALIDGRVGSITIRVDETLGIFSETAPTIIPGVDTFFGTFSGFPGFFTEFRADTVVKMEGRSSLRMRIRSSGVGYAGWFISWGDSTRVADESFTRDMSRFAAGTLRFWVLSPVDLEAGIRSSNVAPGAEGSKTLLTTIGVAPGPSWKRVCMPLRALSGPSPLADLSRTKVLFVVAVNAASGGTADTPVDVVVDDVRWDSRAC